MEHIKIGKDVLESLTVSMYEDHKSLYREYIQNSCDAIDRAVKNKILNNVIDGEIHISIDRTKREISILEDYLLLYNLSFPQRYLLIAKSAPLLHHW